MGTRYLLLVFLLIGAAAIGWMTPVQPDDANTVKFELATSVSRARPLLGEFDSDSWVRMRKTFERDALFIFGYVGFFVVVGLGTSRVSAPLAGVIVLLAVAVGVFDVLENTYGLEALSENFGGASDLLLQKMSSWSRLKWFALGPLSLAVAGAAFARRGSTLGTVGAALFAVAGVVFMVSWVAPSVLYSRWSLVPLMMAMVVHTVVAFRQRS